MQTASKNTIQPRGLNWRGLTKNDTTVLKGICISMIVLHNYFHSFPNWGIENEFAFSPSKFEYFRTHISPNLYTTIGLLFSYLGHYGVQMFVFLSAYGLYLSHETKPLRYWTFVKDRIWKLWPAFFIAVLFLIALTIITTRRVQHTDLYLGSLLRLSLLSNLVSGKSFDVVGPWWFYSMIVQFYLFFPLLRSWFARYGLLPLVLLSVFSWIMQYFFTAKLNALGWTLNTLLIGHLPVFCLGILLAKYKNYSMPLWLFLATCGLFFIGNFFMSGWVFSQTCVTILFLYSYVFLKKFATPHVGFFKNLLFFIGHLSMYLFAVNGFLRHPFIQQAQRHPGMFIKVIMLIAFLLFVTFIALLLRFAEGLFVKTFSKPHVRNIPVKTA